MSSLSFAPNGDDRFEGIFKHLREESGGNIDKYVHVYSSSGGSPSTVIDFSNDNAFQTNNNPSGFIIFEFKGNSVAPTHYQIKSGSQNFPKSWVIEGSKDSCNWQMLDEQRNCSYLNGQKRNHVFSLYNSSNSEFKQIRMRQTDANCSGNYILSIGKFELYGRY